MAKPNKGLIKYVQEFSKAEKGIELCVDCPLHEEYVPIVDNCIEAVLREDGLKGEDSVRLHGKPSDFWYDVTSKCMYARGISSKPSGDLKGIICVHGEEDYLTEA